MALAASCYEGVWRFGERCEVEVLSQTSSLYIHNKRVDLFVHLLFTFTSQTSSIQQWRTDSNRKKCITAQFTISTK